MKTEPTRQLARILAPDCAIQHTGCPLCPAGEGCKAAADCLSKVCWAGVCQPPKCDDGIQNGDETEWDCGGTCSPCP